VVADGSRCAPVRAICVCAKSGQWSTPGVAVGEFPNSGSGGKRYMEGWVEFESKKVVKLVGESLNMTRVANQKGSIHYDDLWNMKYLKGFKWSHLTKKVAYECRVREQKLCVEMMEVRRENSLYVAQVEVGKKLDHIKERRKKRKVKEDGGSSIVLMLREIKKICKI